MDYQSEEIDLINYLKVIHKRKQLIFGLFLIGLVVGWGVYFLMPKSYQAEIILEIGSFFEYLEETPIHKLIEEAPQIAEKINEGFYGHYPNLKATPQNIELVKVEVIRRTPEEAQKILNDVKKEILADNNEKLDFQKSNVEKRKNEYEELISKHQWLIENFKKDIPHLKKDISNLVLQGQQVAVLQAKVYDFQANIYDLQLKIAKLQLKVKEMQELIESFQPTKMVDEPIIFKKEPNLILNLIISGILGIFLGIILAFSKEWWEENKAGIYQ